MCNSWGLVSCFHHTKESHLDVCMCFHAYIVIFQADSQPTLQGSKTSFFFFNLSFPPVSSLPLKKHKNPQVSWWKAQAGRSSEVTYCYCLYDSCFSVAWDPTVWGAVESTRRKDGLFHQRDARGLWADGWRVCGSHKTITPEHQAINSLARDSLFVNQRANELASLWGLWSRHWRTRSYFLKISAVLWVPL